MPLDFTLARLAPRPLCWNLYDTAEAAQADLERANASAERHGEPPYRPMTYSEFAAAKRRHYLAPEANPLSEITEARYFEMLEVLPPLRWEHAEGVERFLMCEMLDGTITEQFARQNGRFWSRRADARDRETWITGAEIARHLAQQDSQVSAPPSPAFDPALVTITRHRQSVTQQEVTIAYDGRVIWNHAGDYMQLRADGEYRGHDDAYWIEVTRKHLAT